MCKTSFLRDSTFQFRSFLFPQLSIFYFIVSVPGISQSRILCKSFERSELLTSWKVHPICFRNFSRLLKKKGVPTLKVNADRSAKNASERWFDCEVNGAMCHAAHRGVTFTWRDLFSAARVDARMRVGESNVKR